MILGGNNPSPINFASLRTLKSPKQPKQIDVWTTTAYLLACLLIGFNSWGKGQRKNGGRHIIIIPTELA